MNSNSLSQQIILYCMDEIEQGVQDQIDKFTKAKISDEDKCELCKNLLEIAKNNAMELLNIYNSRYDYNKPINPSPYTNQKYSINIFIPCAQQPTQIIPPIMPPITQIPNPYYNLPYQPQPMNSINYSLTLPSLIPIQPMKPKHKKHKKDEKNSKSKSKSQSKKGKEKSKKFKHDHKSSEKGQSKSPYKKIIFEKSYNSLPFSGIFSELTSRNNGNINDQNVIEITGNRKTSSNAYGGLSTLVDYNYSGRCYSSSDDQNSFICFDFKKHVVCLTAYSIKSSKFINGPFLLSWVIEGSNDKLNWIKIDERTSQNEMKQSEIEKTFSVNDESKKKLAFRYIKLRATEVTKGSGFGRDNRTSSQSDGKEFTLMSIEMFGKYCSKE